MLNNDITKPAPAKEINRMFSYKKVVFLLTEVVKVTTLVAEVILLQVYLLLLLIAKGMLVKVILLVEVLLLGKAAMLWVEVSLAALEDMFYRSLFAKGR